MSHRQPKAVRVMMSNPEEMGFQASAQHHDRPLGRDEQRGRVLHHRVLRLPSSQANEAVAFTFEDTRRNSEQTSGSGD